MKTEITSETVERGLLKTCFSTRTPANLVKIKLFQTVLISQKPATIESAKTAGFGAGQEAGGVLTGPSPFLPPSPLGRLGAASSFARTFPQNAHAKSISSTWLRSSLERFFTFLFFPFFKKFVWLDWKFLSPERKAVFAHRLGKCTPLCTLSPGP